MRATLIAILIMSAIANARPRVAQNQKDDQDDRGDKDKDKDQGDGESEGLEGQAMLPMKLDDLIEVAVRLAPDLVRAKIDRVAAAAAAQGERRAQAWTLTASGEFKRTAQAEKVDAAPFSVVAEEDITGGVGIGRNIPTGGSVLLQLGLEHDQKEYLIVTRLRDTVDSAQAPAGTNPAGDPYDYLLKTTATLKATFKQPLLRGFGPSVALAPQKKADLAASEATVKAQLAGEEMVRDVVTAYWELALAASEVDVRQQALDLAKKQEELTHEQMRAGTAPSSAINAVTYEIQLRQEAKLRAQIELEHKSLDLRRKAGLPLGRREILLRPGEPFEIGEDEFDVDDMLARSRAANRKLADIQLQKKVADIDVGLARDQMKPEIDLTVTGALIGNADQATGALGSLGGAESYEVTVGLKMSFEISGAAARTRDAAMAKRRKLDIDREDLERQIDTAVVNAVHTVAAARTRVSLADKAILVAEENVRSERASFMVGRTTNYQVMQRQTELIEGRLRRGQAVSDFHKAVAQLQFLSGIILNQYRVNVRPHVDTARRGDRG